MLGQFIKCHRYNKCGASTLMLGLFKGSKGYGDLVLRLRKAIESGNLSAGVRLPSQRRLAYDLGIAVGTVTHAYRVAEREGLIASYVGRGSFVAFRTLTPIRKRHEKDSDADIDLSIDEPLETLNPSMSEVMRAIASDRSADSLMEYHNPLWKARHREAGADWIRKFGYAISSSENVVVCAGAQHAIMCSLAAICRPGDVVMAEELSYPGFRAAVEMLGIRIEPLKVDAHGIVPSAVEHLCAKSPPKALYVTSSCQNPTNCQLNATRRAHLGRLAEKYDFAIIEDELRPRSVLPAPQPIAAHAPDHTFFIAGVSKTLGGGLRVGFLVVPKRWRNAFTTSVWASIYAPSPITAEIVTRLIADGTADRTALIKEKEAKRRRSIAEDALGHWDLRTRAGSTTAWLSLPKPWRVSEAVLNIRQHGISVAPSDAFWNARTPPPDAIRLSLGSPRSIEPLKVALDQIAAILSSPPQLVRL